MLVKSKKNEYINLDLIAEYSFDGSILRIKKDARPQVYTLTDASAERLRKYLEKETESER